MQIGEVNIMEKKLRSMMDFQRFQPNSRLASLISQTESRYGTTASRKAQELSDDMLTFVNAAGDPNLEAARRAEKDNND